MTLTACPRPDKACFPTAEAALQTRALASRRRLSLGHLTPVFCRCGNWHLRRGGRRG